MQSKNIHSIVLVALVVHVHTLSSSGIHDVWTLLIKQRKRNEKQKNEHNNEIKKRNDININK